MGAVSGASTGDGGGVVEVRSTTEGSGSLLLFAAMVTASVELMTTRAFLMRCVGEKCTYRLLCFPTGLGFLRAAAGMPKKVSHVATSCC